MSAFWRDNFPPTQKISSLTQFRANRETVSDGQFNTLSAAYAGREKLQAPRVARIPATGDCGVRGDKAAKSTLVSGAKLLANAVLKITRRFDSKGAPRQVELGGAFYQSR